MSTLKVTTHDGDHIELQYEDLGLADNPGGPPVFYRSRFIGQFADGRLIDHVVDIDRFIIDHHGELRRRYEEGFALRDHFAEIRWVET